MRRGARLNWGAILRRARSAPGLLLLMGLVVTLTTALTAAVAPLTERTADDAMAASVRDAGLRAAVVATVPEGYDDPRGAARDPRALAEVRLAADAAQKALPAPLAAALRPGITTLSTPALQLLDAGAGRYLRLSFVDTPEGPASVTYTDGRPPQATAGTDRSDQGAPTDAGLWPVQVALSQAVASALGLVPGDRISAEDEQDRPVRIVISGIYVATDPDDLVWQVSTDLLHPTQGPSQGVEHISATALVSAASLADLRVAVPADDLTHHVVFTPEPTRVRWRQSSALQRATASLQASAGQARGDLTWDSLLGRVLDDGHAQVASARGQAQVLIVGLIACALLLLVLAGELLVRRRSGPLTMARERGASLLGIGVELLVEALAVAAAAAAVGVAVTHLLVGSAAWGWSLPVLVVAALAAPLMGAVLASHATDARRAPANRAARRTAARARAAPRLAVEAAVLAAAALSFVALRQRGVVTGGEDGGDLAATSAATWWAVAGTLLVLRLMPPAARLLLRSARRSTGVVRLVVAARIAQTGVRALPLLVVSIAVAQLTVGVALIATEQSGQSAGALLAVGGDARLTAAPDLALEESAREVAEEPDVRAAASGRVADGVPATSRTSADTVRLVVVDAAAYRRLLTSSTLPDAPALALLSAEGPEGGRVPALLLGGDADLRDDLAVHWDDDTIALEVVGTAPRVQASIDPVVVVDAQAFAGAGALAVPDTVWAVGPGAATALLKVSPSSGSVTRYADDLDARRHAPLAAGLVALAAASSALLLLFALIAVLLSAAAEAPARAESMGRLRSLGLRDSDLQRVMASEVLAPVVVAALTGLVLGVGCAHAMFNALSLQRITGQVRAPDPVVPWWTVLAGAILLAITVAVSALEWRRLRRRGLAELLRS